MPVSVRQEDRRTLLSSSCGRASELTPHCQRCWKRGSSPSLETSTFRWFASHTLHTPSYTLSFQALRRPLPKPRCRAISLTPVGNCPFTLHDALTFCYSAGDMEKLLHVSKQEGRRAQVGTYQSSCI